MSLNNIKTELRKAARKKRDEFNEGYVLAASKKVCEHVLSSKELELAHTILLYYPVNNELSPLHLINQAQKMGKSIAFPICNRVDHTLTFKKVSGVSELTRTSFGLFEPVDSCEDISIDENTLCIVPAILFSRDGHRLGYGMGYYDRLLENFKGKSVGLSYSALLCDSLPHEEHDVPLNMIITESEVLYIAK